MTDPDNRDDIEQWVIRSRAEQGLPPRVEDVTTLRAVAAMLRLHTNHDLPKTAHDHDLSN